MTDCEDCGATTPEACECRGEHCPRCRQDGCECAEVADANNDNRSAIDVARGIWGQAGVWHE